MRKRGQVSFFIVAGLVLVFAVGLFLVIMSNQVPQTSDIVPEAKTPLERFVAGCMKRTAMDGLFLMGLQGGYVQVPEAFRSHPMLAISPHPEVPVRTPVWYYEGQRYAPSIAQMEAELAGYVTEHVRYCLQNLSDVDVIEGVVELGEPNATVRINTGDVYVRMGYEVVTDQGDRRSSRDMFAISIPVTIPAVHEVATSVMDALVREDYLEEFTIHLMAAADPVIPMSGMTLSCDEPVWIEHQVQQEIADLLYYNIPRIRLQNTNHRPYQEPQRAYEKYSDLSMEEFESRYCTEKGCTLPDRPSDHFEYTQLQFDAGLPAGVDDERISVSFRYLPHYPFIMNVRPSSDGQMRSVTEQGESEYLDFFCMNVYHFTYDLIFPVEVVVHQEGAYGDGTDMVLRYTIPVMIEKNLPSKTSFSSVHLMPQQGDEAFCNSTFDQDTHIYALDTVTGERIGEVDVSFDCINMRCPLGSTRSELNGVQRLTTRLPSGCYGGIIRAQKQGYVSDSMQVRGDEDGVELRLHPLRPVYYRVDMSQNNLHSAVPSAPVPLTDRQVAYVTLQSLDMDYKESFVYDPTQQAQYLEFLAGGGSYNLTVYVYDDSVLIGGYAGTIEVGDAQMQKMLIIHAYEQIPHPQDTVSAGKLYMFLKEDEEYKASYVPEWR